MAYWQEAPGVVWRLKQRQFEAYELLQAAGAPVDGGGVRQLLAFLSGEGGMGKSTLIQRLLREVPGVFGFSVSSTTRPPRGADKDTNE